MNALDRLVPSPCYTESDHVDLAVGPDVAWERIQNGHLLPQGMHGVAPTLSSLWARARRVAAEKARQAAVEVPEPTRPGFAVLVDDPPREVVVGAVVRALRPDVPARDVGDEAAFSEFSEPGYVKVVWSLAIAARGTLASRVTWEVRAHATSERTARAWWLRSRILGRVARRVRRGILAGLVRELGTPRALEPLCSMPGDDLVQDASIRLTEGKTIRATPEAIWPWLVQMGCRRAGFYSLDALGNAGARSAREVHEELLDLMIGDRVPARPDGRHCLEVLHLEPRKSLLLGAHYDATHDRCLAFHAPSPERYARATWAFVLEPLDEHTTRLRVRMRVAFSEHERRRVAAIRPLHAVLQTAQLRNVAQRAERRLPQNDVHDVVDGARGATLIALSAMSPFMRGWRSHWGVSWETAARIHPGDELVPSPSWSFTHGIDIDAPRSEVWSWMTQMGADRGGFYSYQWLANAVGANVRNAETIHPEWAASRGQRLTIHPDLPGLDIIAVAPRKYLLARYEPDEATRDAGEPWVAASWLLLVEPLGQRRCRVVSRLRVASSHDLPTRLVFGRLWGEPVSFAMDRRMLLGIKERAERRFRAQSLNRRRECGGSAAASP